MLFFCLTMSSTFDAFSIDVTHSSYLKQRPSHTILYSKGGVSKSRYANEEEKKQAEWESNYRKRNGALALKQKLQSMGIQSIEDVIRERKKSSEMASQPEKKRGALSTIDIIKGTFSGIGSDKSSSNSIPSKASSSVQEDEGYGLLGTLSRAGPIPLTYRLFLSSQYEAAVTKFMLREKCTRIEAMANMDYYFRNPNDWIEMRKKYEKTGVKVDLVNMNQDPKSLALVAIWGTVSTFYIWRIYAFVVLGIDYKDNFWGF